MPRTDRQFSPYLNSSLVLISFCPVVSAHEVAGYLKIGHRTASVCTKLPVARNWRNTEHMRSSLS